MSIPLFVEAEDLITKEEVVDKEEVAATQAAVILLKNGKIYRQRNAPEYIARERTEKTNRTPVVAPAVVMVVVVIKTHEAVVEVDIIIMNTNTGLLISEANHRTDDVSEITRTTNAVGNRIDFNNGMTRRRTSAIYSSVRRIVSARSARNQDAVYGNNEDYIACRAELDSHADTCGLNDTAYILEYTN